MASLVLHGANVRERLGEFLESIKKDCPLTCCRAGGGERVFRLHKKEFPTECKTLGKNLTKPDFSLWLFAIQDERDGGVTSLFMGSENSRLIRLDAIKPS
ncbi:hypothetical protein D3C81_703840 [compost metagenome]